MGKMGGRRGRGRRGGYQGNVIGCSWGGLREKRDEFSSFPGPKNSACSM